MVKLNWPMLLPAHATSSIRRKKGFGGDIWRNFNPLFHRGCSTYNTQIAESAVWHGQQETDEPITSVLVPLRKEPFSECNPCTPTLYASTLSGRTHSAMMRKL